jgi:hypothetical protein
MPRTFWKTGTGSPASKKVGLWSHRTRLPQADRAGAMLQSAQPVTGVAIEKSEAGFF